MLRTAPGQLAEHLLWLIQQREGWESAAPIAQSLVEKLKNLEGGFWIGSVSHGLAGQGTAWKKKGKGKGK